MAKRDPRLKKRGGWYYVRVKVPPELRDILGRWEFTFSLRTSELSEARRLLHLRCMEIDGKIEEAKRQLKARPIRNLAPSEVEYLALKWFHEGAVGRLHASASGSAHLTDEEAEIDARYAMAAFADSHNPDGQAALDGAPDLRPDSPIHLKAAGALKQLLFSEGIELDTDSEAYLRLRELIRRASLEHARRDLKALQQDFSQQEGDALFAELDGTAPPVKRVAPITFRQLTKLYREEPSRAHLSPKSRLKDTARFRLFEEVVRPKTPISEITRAHASELIELLSTLPANASKRFPKLTAKQAAAHARATGLPPMSPTSAKSYFTAFASLMRFAVDRGYREDNPAERLKVRADTVPARHRRNPFSTAQLKAIFGAPLYTGCVDDKRGYTTPGDRIIRRGRFWVPLIALFSGMRLNEICQLEVADITSADGTDIILVRGNDDDTKRVKTEAGTRYVPIHPELKRIGLLHYHAAMAERGERWLFPELPVGSTGYRSDGFSKWFARFLASVGAASPRTSFHSFRHSYRDALREADISAERVRALGGWSSNRVEEAYGSGLRPATLGREIRKVRYTGLDLSQLHENC